MYKIMFDQSVENLDKQLCTIYALINSGRLSFMILSFITYLKGDATRVLYIASNHANWKFISQHSQAYIWIFYNGFISDRGISL